MLQNQKPSPAELIQELLGQVDTIRALVDLSVKAGISVPFEQAKLVSQTCAVILQSDRYAKAGKAR